MTENKQFMKNSLIIMISEIAVKLKGMVFLPLITKTFGAFNYGIWAQVSIIQGIINPLVVMGLDSASTRFVSGQPKDKAAKSFSAIYIWLIIVSCLFGAGIIYFAPTIAESFFGGKENAKFVVLCAPAILIGVLLSMLRCYYRILNQAKKFTLIRIVESLLPIIPLIIVLMLGLSLFSLVTFNILSSLIVILIFIFPLFALIGVKKPDFSILPGFLKFGAAIMPAGYAMWVLNASDRLFIAKFCNFSELGVYSCVYVLGYMFINFFFNPFWVMYPARAAELYNKNKIEQLSQLYQKSTKVVLFFMIPTMCGLSVLGKPFMWVFTTEEFVHGGSLMIYVTLGYMFHMLASYFSTNLGLANRPIFSTVNLYICAVTNLVLNYFFIRSHGITGAAIATCFSFGLQFVLEYAFSHRFTKIRLGFDWLSFMKTVASSVVMISMLVLFSLWKVDNLPGLILSVAAGSTVYFLCQYILKFFNFEEALAGLDIIRVKKYSSYFPLKQALEYLR
jgi:O-antigen/teichoic acid export membrane protein